MTPERQKILAQEILDLSNRLDNEAEEGVDVDLEDYINIQEMAGVLARAVLGISTAKKPATGTDTGAIRLER
jgi:hypothetical protein